VSVIPADLCAVVVAQQRVVEPLDGVGHAVVGASWINQIETWFGIITRQAIRRGTFASVKALVKQIRDYIAPRNADARPFTWTATVDEILAKVALTQTNIRKLVDNNAK
jgi:hypothetical protein